MSFEFGDNAPQFPHTYDYYIVAFSGGKDSIACLLHLLDEGIPKERIELWHHEIDGREGSVLKMDWECTPDYCRKFAEHFEIPIYFSWKTRGFEGEMLREDESTASSKFEDQDYNIIECGGAGPKGTRLKFPQVTANLRQRWCSAYLKIDVCTKAINNQKRFLGKRTLVITGERAEESSARAKYKVLEPDRTSCKSRLVDHWRPVHDWSEKKVWNIIEKYKVNPHPAYKLGWGRLSCAACIFGSHNQWASLNKVDHDRINIMSNYEKQFDLTIHRKMSIDERVKIGESYDMNPELIRKALEDEYTDPVTVQDWETPSGAYGDSSGPT